MTFEDIAINAMCRRLGGWPKCCSLPKRMFNQKLKRKFLQLYRRMIVNGVSERNGRRLLGLHDLANIQDDFLERVRPPVRIHVEGRS